jgi:hypothetical protein
MNWLPTPLQKRRQVFIESIADFRAKFKKPGKKIRGTSGSLFAAATSDKKDEKRVGVEDTGTLPFPACSLLGRKR